MRPSFGPSRVIKHGKQKPPQTRGADSACFPNRPGISGTALAGGPPRDCGNNCVLLYRQPTVPYLKVTCHKAEERQTKNLISRVCSRQRPRQWFSRASESSHCFLCQFVSLYKSVVGDAACPGLRRARARTRPRPLTCFLLLFCFEL